MNKLILSVLACIAVSCVPGNSPVRIVDVTAPTAKDCKPGTPVGAGSLDVSGAVSYHVFLTVHNSAAKASIQDNENMELLTGDENAFVGTEVVLSYTSVNPKLTFETERLPFTDFIGPAGETDYLLDIIGLKAKQKLIDQVTDSTANPPMTLTVKIEIKGHTESGTTMPVNPIYYPITVFISGTSCALGPAPQPLCSTAGQDGNAIACCTGPGAPVGCP